MLCSYDSPVSRSYKSMFLLPEGYFNQYYVMLLKIYSCVCRYFKAYLTIYIQLELNVPSTNTDVILKRQKRMGSVTAHALIKVCNVLKMFLKHLLRSSKKKWKN